MARILRTYRFVRRLTVVLTPDKAHDGLARVLTPKSILFRLPVDDVLVDSPFESVPYGDVFLVVNTGPTRWTLFYVMTDDGTFALVTEQFLPWFGVEV
jgi:hypothetical protein